MKEKNTKISKNKTTYLPTEIIWLIFTYSDMATLARCSSVCSDWNLLSQPFWIRELTTFLEKLKNEREGMENIDVMSLVDITKEKGNTAFILNQLHKQETIIEKYQEKLNALEERAMEKRVRQPQQVFFAVDAFGGGYYVGGGHQPSFFGDIKRMFNKSRYKGNLENAEEKENKIIRKLV